MALVSPTVLTALELTFETWSRRLVADKRVAFVAKAFRMVDPFDAKRELFVPYPAGIPHLFVGLKDGAERPDIDWADSFPIRYEQYDSSNSRLVCMRRAH